MNMTLNDWIIRGIGRLHEARSAVAEMENRPDPKEGKWSVIDIEGEFRIIEEDVETMMRMVSRRCGGVVVRCRRIREQQQGAE